MTVQNINKNQKGFTLIELLVVIGILAILLAITLIAINPAARFGQANDTKRRSDISQILSAVGQYQATNAGQLPPELVTASSSATAVNNVNFPNLCGQIVTDFAPSLPVDPSVTTNIDPNGTSGIVDCTTATWETGYSIAVDAQGRVTVSAPSAYDTTTTIQVTR